MVSLFGHGDITFWDGISFEGSTDLHICDGYKTAIANYLVTAVEDNGNEMLDPYLRRKFLIYQC